jgi:hypothetical protein
MKSKKVLALILLLAGIVACVISFQRFIVYSDASDSARSFGYDADRASGQKRMDMERDADSRYDRVKAPKTQAIISGLIGAGLIVASVVLLVRRRPNGGADMNTHSG